MQRIVDRVFVLGRINYGEADRIVTCLSEHHGKLTVMAKGVRKPKSKLAGGLEVFNLNEITYIPGKKDICSLVSSRLLQQHSNIVKNYETSEDMFGILKWLNDHLEQGTGSEYFFITNGAHELADDKRAKAAIWFYMRTLELSGHGLDPFHGPSGAKLEPSEAYTFDFDTSTFSPKTEADYTQDDIKLLRLAVTLKAADFARIATSEAQEQRLKRLIKTVLQQTF